MAARRRAVEAGTLCRQRAAVRRPIYHAKFFGHYSHLTSEHVQHLASIGAQEFHSWFPIVEDPERAHVRLWAHAIAHKAIAEYPELFSEGPSVHDDGRVHIHVSSNAEGRWSIMPYSVRTTGSRVAAPVTWNELRSPSVRAAQPLYR